MRHFRLSAFMALMMWALNCLAQSDQGVARLPTGLRIPATLQANLSSQKARVGDPIKLDVFSAVHGKDGKIVIPAHATLTGVITQVVPFHGEAQPAVLSFAVQSAEWKGGGGSLDAAVFGVLALTDFRKPGANKAMGAKEEYQLEQTLRGYAAQGEMVEDVPAATLRHQDSVDIVDYRDPNWIPGAAAVRDPKVEPMKATAKVMELKLSTEAKARTFFTSAKHDVELPKEYLVVLLNGMKVVQ